MLKFINNNNNRDKDKHPILDLTDEVAIEISAADETGKQTISEEKVSVEKYLSADFSRDKSPVARLNDLLKTDPTLRIKDPAVYLQLQTQQMEWQRSVDLENSAVNLEKSILLMIEKSHDQVMQIIRSFQM